MVIRRKTRKRKVGSIRRKRRNPVSPARSGMVRSNPRRKRRKNPMKGKRVRPLLWRRGVGKRARYYRGPKSRMPERINAKRRRRYARRRNPSLKIKQIFGKQMLMQAASIAGGITLGYLAMPLLWKVAPDSVKAQRNFFGIAHILLGGLMATMLKNKNLKAMGVVVAGTGVYDLIACNVPQLDLKRIPTDNLMFDNMMGGTLAIEHQGASYPGARVPSMSLAASYPASLNSSYESVGNVYQEMGCY